VRHGTVAFASANAFFAKVVTNHRLDRFCSIFDCSDRVIRNGYILFWFWSFPIIPKFPYKVNFPVNSKDDACPCHTYTFPPMRHTSRKTILRDLFFTFPNWERDLRISSHDRWGEVNKVRYRIWWFFIYSIVRIFIDLRPCQFQSIFLSSLLLVNKNRNKDYYGGYPRFTDKVGMVK
jgi:hypothetical protein